MKNQKGVAPILLILVVVAVLAAGGLAVKYTIDSQKEADQELARQDELVQKSNEELAEEDNESADETADWQTYRNEECGYEIKYSKDYQVDEFEKSVSFITPQNIECHQQGGPTETMCDEVNSGPAIMCEPTAEFLDSFATLQEYIDDRIKSHVTSSIFEPKTVNVGGYSGIEVEGLGAGGSYKDIYLQIGNNTLWFDVLKEGNAEGIKIFDQMLSTFKFFEPQGVGCTAFLNEPTGQRDKISLPVDCEIAIGKGFTGWRFKVPAGQKSNAQFEFEIYNENGKLVQKIPEGEINYSPTVSTIAYTNSDDINFADDINFDDYKDLRVLKLLAAQNEIYDYWFFDPPSRMFKKDSVLTDVPNPSFNADKKTIEGYVASGPDSSEWTIVKYEFVGGVYKKSTEKGN